MASLLLYRLLLNRPQSAKAAPATAQIVLATRDIEVGTVLKEEDVKLADWPGAVPPARRRRPRTSSAAASSRRSTPRSR